MKILKVLSTCGCLSENKVVYFLQAFFKFIFIKYQKMISLKILNYSYLKKIIKFL